MMEFWLALNKPKACKPGQSAWRFILGQISLLFGRYEIWRWKFPKNLSKSEFVD
jgi:hypothetical protein